MTKLSPPRLTMAIHRPEGSIAKFLGEAPLLGTCPWGFSRPESGRQVATVPFHSSCGDADCSASPAALPLADTDDFVIMGYKGKRTIEDMADLMAQQQLMSKEEALPAIRRFLTFRNGAQAERTAFKRSWRRWLNSSRLASSSS